MFGVAAIYNIIFFFRGESLRVQTGGLGGILSEGVYMSFMLHSNISSSVASSYVFLTGGQDILHILEEETLCAVFCQDKRKQSTALSVASEGKRNLPLSDRQEGEQK